MTVQFNTDSDTEAAEAATKRINLRMPPDLYQLLAERARSQDRSVHAQTLRLLRQSLGAAKPEPGTPTEDQDAS